MQNTTGVFPAIFSSLVEWHIVKGFFSMTPCIFFLYVNLVMLFTLRSKEIFCETPRYILFCHLLLSDSLQLGSTFVYYILYSLPLNEATLSIMSYICFYNYVLSRITNNFLTPIYLTLMSLERYIAICFPLRHAQIASKRRTMVAVMAVWTLGLIIWTTDLCVAMVFQAGSSTRKRTCSDYIVSQMSVSYQVNTGSIALVFTLACVLIIYVYIAIVVVARSTTTTEKSSASKAHKTVLLHMVQLCLCLSSLLMGTVRRTLAMSGMDPVRHNEVSYVLFLMLNILPRCLSPLIYGLRDKTFCACFRIHFLFCFKSKVQPSTLDI